MDRDELRQRLAAGQIVESLEVVGLNRARIRLPVEPGFQPPLLPVGDEWHPRGIIRKPPPGKPARYEEHDVDAACAEVALDSWAAPPPPEGL